MDRTVTDVVNEALLNYQGLLQDLNEADYPGIEEDLRITNTLLAAIAIGKVIELK